MTLRFFFRLKGHTRDRGTTVRIDPASLPPRLRTADGIALEAVRLAAARLGCAPDQLVFLRIMKVTILTVVLLRRETGQCVARPVSIVTNEAEGLEILRSYMGAEGVPVAPVAWASLDTDYPIAAYKTPRGTVVDWFAFTYPR